MQLSEERYAQMKGVGIKGGSSSGKKSRVRGVEVEGATRRRRRVVRRWINIFSVV
jgi:hypothetical protein